MEIEIEGRPVYEEDPIHFWMCNICMVTSHLLFNMSTQSMTPKPILFLLAKLVPDGNMFGKDDGFPDSSETRSSRDFRAVMHYDYRLTESVKKTSLE